MKEYTDYELRKALGQVLTMQYDYPPNGEGSVGYKGDNMYRFKTKEEPLIQLYIMERLENYSHSYNIDILAQEIITDLLDQGMITFDGYGYRKQKEKKISI